MLPRVLVEIDPQFFRPCEVAGLVGDASKAKSNLDWHPTVDFRELVEMMVDADVKSVKDERASHEST